MEGMRSVVDVHNKGIFLSLGCHGMCLMSGFWYFSEVDVKNCSAIWLMLQSPS
jgi:hypothetical protein